MSLQDALDDLEDDLEDSEQTVDDQPGPLAGQPLADLTGSLASAMNNATTAQGFLSGFTGQDQNTFPSGPSLPVIAADCVALAGYAKEEAATQAHGWQQRAANHLVTVKRLIDMDPGGYRKLAGIT